MYVADTFAKTVWVIDVASRMVVTGVAVDVWAALFRRPSLAVTADGAFVYVGNRDNAVTVIDTETNTVVAEIDVGGPVKDIAIAPGISR